MKNIINITNDNGKVIGYMTLTEPDVEMVVKEPCKLKLNASQFIVAVQKMFKEEPTYNELR